MRWEVCEGKEHRVAARAELAIALGISNDLGVKWGLPKRRMLCSILLQPCIFFALPISCPAVQGTAWSHVNKEKITSYMIRELKENLFLLRVSQWLWQWFANIGLWPQVNFFFFSPLGFGYSHEPGRDLCQLKCMAATGVSWSLELSGVTTGWSLGRQHYRVRNKHLPGADFP